ncbi:unnamed protein product, partial [Choristocarpus tenellus]
EELLVGSGLISPPPAPRAGKKMDTLFSSRLRKINTDLVYKQRKFNLLKEETEGYAKLCVLLSGVRGGEGEAVQAAANMRSLIGYFDIDPNRCVLIYLL